ncbi:MAG: EAL domain-containing protein [Methylotenera sp.]|nr:EAL domain-containing protein [Methylotenera sp.]
MITELQIMDCLCQRILRVNALQKYHDVVTEDGIKPNAFAVFDDEDNFLDIVEARQAALFPGRVFSDLLVRRKAAPMSPDTALDKIQARFEAEKCEFLAVIDDNQFIGVISNLSLMNALIKQERKLQHERNALIKKLGVELNYRKLAALVFENTSEGILITDEKAQILHVNRGFTKTTGYALADVVGKTPSILHSGRQSDEFYQTMWKTLRETGCWEGELWNRRKNGDVYPEWLHINAVCDADSKIVNYVGVFSDLGPNKKLQQELHQLAYFDPLTNLPNRRLLFDRLQQAVISSTRNHLHGAILFIDLDHFKTLNDTKGHNYGDLLLHEVAQRLQLCVREGDTVARLGGDEFVIMLEGLHSKITPAASQAEAIANKILTILNQVYSLDKHEYHGSASIGIGLFCGSQTSIEDLLKHADTAMYQAKADGRNTLRFFDPAMQVTLETRSTVESDLRQALAQQQFTLYYQTQVDHNHRIFGAETLLRWEHPQRGLVSPSEFIPFAEETGLIIPIGDFVLKTACTQLKTWQANAQTRDLTLAVNISVRQFRHPDFVEQVRSMLEQTGANPNKLKLELTESIIISDLADTIVKMLALKTLGVSFSMDDFGTGYSSLTYLKRLPFNQLKIDQSFIRDIATDLNDTAIVKTIIVMATALGLDIVAEGVETEAQLDLLKQYGCPAFQGYLFSKPLPLAEFERLLA